MGRHGQDCQGGGTDTNNISGERGAMDKTVLEQNLDNLPWAQRLGEGGPVGAS